VHRHDFHELFFFATGSGEHMIDLEPVPVGPPCVHVVAPGQVHQLSRSAATTGTVVMFTEAAWMAQAGATEPAFHSNVMERAFPISPAMLAEAEALIGMIETEVARGAERMDGAVNGLLGVLLLKTAHWMRQARPEGPTTTDRNDPVQRFLRAVEAGFLQHRPISAYAEELALSPGHLNELVRKRLGKSAGAVVQDRLVLEAKRLLLHSGLSVKEVSYALQLQDPAYFNRFFKKAVGHTPLAYREHIRGKYKP
jgi:AraC-like DNA-binding protein